MQKWYLLVATVGAAGFAFGYLRRSRDQALMGWLLFGSIAYLVAVLLLAKLFDSDILGWIFGLSLILGLPLLVVFGSSFALGSFSNRNKIRTSDAQHPTTNTFKLKSIEAAPPSGSAPNMTTVPSRRLPPGHDVAGCWAREALAPYTAVTCTHLQPIEHAMRACGIQVHIQNAIHLRADCEVNLESLAQLLGPWALDFYQERHDIDRSYFDPKSALFWCDACQSRLTVVHPEEAAWQTPWFPFQTAPSEA